MRREEQPLAHLSGSAMAAVINFPLWKASAIAQSGYQLEGARSWRGAYVQAISPPYKGALAVVLGMTWARAAIFWGSEVGRNWLQAYLGEARDRPSALSLALPPLVVSSCVQVVNQPVVRASIMLQDPSSAHRTLADALRAIAKERGLAALWHGTSAGIAKTVPKYCVAVSMKDVLERRLPHVTDERAKLARSALKACCAATLGALLTNPLDVLRNTMFKTHLPMFEAVRHLNAHHPRFAWFSRGWEKNLISVAVPVACTIFFTDQLTPLFAG